MTTGRHSWRRVLALGAGGLLGFAPGLVCAQDPAEQSLLDLDMEQLLSLKVNSVSRSEETVAEAPAHVLVVTAQELRERGYRDISELFDDLPGIDVSRPHGDNSFVAYWRGIRQQVGIRTSC
jgi:iron complex outermembrane receptor protein